MSEKYSVSNSGIDFLKSQMIDGLLNEFRNIFSLISGYSEMAGESLKNKNVTTVDGDLIEILKGCKRGVETLNRITNLSRLNENIALLHSTGNLIQELSNSIKLFFPKNVVVDIELKNFDTKILIDSLQFQQLILVILLKIRRIAAVGNGQKSINVTVGEVSVPSEKLQLDTEITLPPSSDENAVTPQRINGKILFSKEVIEELNALAQTVCRDAVVVRLEQSHSIKVSIPLSLQIDKNQIPKFKGHPKGSGQKILIIDDEISVAEVTARKLQKLGYQTTIETSPYKALTLLKNQEIEIDLLITDQIMPELTGLQLVQQAKVLREKLKVIMITGYASGLNDAVCKNYGISGLAMKPLDEGELAVMVANQFKLP